jgi:PAS domain S-box-containing protein
MDKSKKKLILNVDDVEAGRYAITRSLLQAGFEVVEATNGSDALKLAEERPDLILLDVNLPDLDGRKVCKMIKANPYTSSIPVVHLSATFVQSEERAEGLEGGADGYLVQPVDPRVLVATIRSLLRLKEAEQSLREMQEWLQTAVSAANVGLWDWDLRTNQIYFSPEWKRQIGYEAYELSNDLLEWQKRIHPDDLDRILQTIQAYSANPESHYQTEFRFRHKDGSYRWILTQASLLFDEQDQPVRMLGSHLDITDQKELEAEKEALAAQFHQAQKMESIGRLAGGIAHHFNNLLVPIIGFAELGMGQVAADSQLHADLGRIKSAAERAAYLTKQILAFSRQQILELKILDLNQVILEFQNMLQHLIGEDIALQTQFAQNLDPIMADKGQLQHVLLNLAVNARDAMPNG